MKNLILKLALVIFGLLMLNACSNDTFCVDDVSHEALIAYASDVSFNLPSGEQYSGPGLMNHEMEIGDYDMSMNIVQIEETPTVGGADVRWVHYFYDNDGNGFWSDDEFALTNTGVTGSATANYDLNIIDGEGDFECPEGKLTFDMVTDFIQNEIDFKVTGNVCGGCE